MWLAGFIFVRRTWMLDQHRVNATFAKVDRLKAPIWVMSFVEGSRLNPTKLREAQEFSEQRDLPVMQHVLVPRVKGFVACMTKLRKSHVKYLYGKHLTYQVGYE
jgi:1-acyl-sn-glycerol-3-phosphate acyltransferase